MRAVMLFAALALIAAAGAPRAADAKGRCPAAHDSSAKTCPKGRAPPIIAKCRDVITHRFAKCGGPNAEPVPAN